MATVEVITTAKKKVGDVALADVIATTRPNRGLLFDAVLALQTNRRQGTVSTKTRGKVRGGGRKPYKQKGTGNARSGSIRSPLYVGGGTTFGPQPRPWRNHLPQKQRVLALAHAMADRVQGQKLIVLESWNCGKTPKTKDVVKVLATLGVKSAVIVLDTPDAVVAKSARNIPWIDIVEARCLNAEHLIRREHVIMTKEALAQVNTRVAA